MSWQHAAALHMREGPDTVMIKFADDGLLHIEYETAGGYRVRQVCTWYWLVQRMFGRAVERLET